MKKAQQITVCLIATATVFAVGSYSLQNREPVYQGKALSAWLAESEGSGHWPRNGAVSPPDEAIQHMGTNAIPTIRRLLNSRGSATKAELVAFLNKQRFEGLKITTESQGYYRAIAACYAFGFDAVTLVPDVGDALDRMDPGCLAFACQWLGSLGRAGQAATPALLRMLQETNNPVRWWAAQTLAGVCGDRREEVVKVLKANIEDINPALRNECTRALELLGEIPPDWKIAGSGSLKAKAESDNPDAQIKLALLYYGLNPRLSTNSIEAYKWAAIAASHDNRQAKYLAREMELFMTSNEVADARIAARAFVESRTTK